jgi:hypothetical protein
MIFVTYGHKAQCLVDVKVSPGRDQTEEFLVAIHPFQIRDLLCVGGYEFVPTRRSLACSRVSHSHPRQSDPVRTRTCTAYARVRDRTQLEANWPVAPLAAAFPLEAVGHQGRLAAPRVRARWPAVLINRFFQQTSLHGIDLLTAPREAPTLQVSHLVRELIDLQLPGFEQLGLLVDSVDQGSS